MNPGELREAPACEEQWYDEVAREAAAAISSGHEATVTLARLASKVPLSLPAPATSAVSARLATALAAGEPMEAVAAEEVDEGEVATVLDDIGGMLHDIRRHAETCVITWSQARRMRRVLDEP